MGFGAGFFFAAGFLAVFLTIFLIGLARRAVFLLFFDFAMGEFRPAVSRAAER
jgi:hypothetical protein